MSDEPFDDEAWQADLDRRADELHGIWLGLVAAWQKWARRPPNREADAGALDDLQMTPRSDTNSATGPKPSLNPCSETTNDRSGQTPRSGRGRTCRDR